MASKSFLPSLNACASNTFSPIFLVPPFLPIVALAIFAPDLPRKPVNKPPRINDPPRYIPVSALLEVGSSDLLIGSVAPTKPDATAPPLTALPANVNPFTKGIGI